MADLKISALTASTTPLAGTEVLPIVQSSTTKQVSVANLTAGRAVSAASLTTTGVVSAQGLQVTTAPALSFGASKWMTQYEGSNTSRTYVCGDGVGSYGVWQIYSATSAGSPIVVCGIDGSFNFNVNSGNVVMGTSGKGIDFAITPGTGTSELLSDYEEGTWTPVLTPGTSGSITLTSPTDSMRYTKVGRVVTLTGLINISSVSSPVGDLRLTGLPFNIGGSGAGSISIFGLGTTSIVTAYQVLVDSGSATTIFIRGYATGNQVATVSNNMQAGGGFYITIQYTV